jgi:hypothetical protein
LQQQPWLMGHHATFSYYSSRFCHLPVSVILDADMTLQDSKAKGTEFKPELI